MAEVLNDNLTIIYYTANHISKVFGDKVRQQLLKVKGNAEIISVSQKPMEFGQNICIGTIGRSHLNIYRQALVGAKAARTKYIAMAEDDILYSPQHFTSHTPSAGVFAYNMSVQSIYTWVKPPVFSTKDRRVLHSMICERELFIEAMEERFKKFPEDKVPDLGLWAEPGKYERQLGVEVRVSEKFYTAIPNIAFSHPTALAFENLGTRKKLGKDLKSELPYWGAAEEILKLYV